MFELIVISTPNEAENEHAILKDLFKAGLKTFHVRKPEWNGDEVRRYIERIPSVYHPFLMLHNHFNLTDEFNLKGIHLTEKARKEVDFNQMSLKLVGKTISAAFHSTEALRHEKRPYDYVLLSPVFDSISKKGYRGAFDYDELQAFLATKKMRIVGLGGIDKHNLIRLMEMGFDGAALLGSIWSSENPVEEFEHLMKISGR